MTFFVGRMPASIDVSKVVLNLLIDVINDTLVQCFLVSFQSQDIIGFAVDDLLRNRFLSSHRVDGDNGAFDIHHPQELRNRRNFVRFFRASDLAQR